MLKAGVLGTGIYHIGQAQLLDACQALKQGMLHDVEQQSPWYLYKSEDRIAYDFAIVQCVLIQLPFPVAVHGLSAQPPRQSLHLAKHR